MSCNELNCICCCKLCQEKYDLCKCCKKENANEISKP